MAQSHYIKSDKSLIDPNKLRNSTDKMYLGEVSEDGKLTKKRGPFIQWYVQTHIPGVYRVVHNLNRIDYAISVSKMTEELLSIETSNLTDVSFDVKITKNGEVVKAPFRFAFNLMV